MRTEKELRFSKKKKWLWRPDALACDVIIRPLQLVGRCRAEGTCRPAPN